MTILRSGILLLLLALPMTAKEWLIATLPQGSIETIGNDRAPDAAVSADRTLVAWHNENPPHANFSRVHLRVIHSGSITSSFAFDRSTATPKIAADESGWLLAYGIPNSRFNQHPYQNVAVRLVSHDGALGDELFLNTSSSSYPNVGSAIRTGEGWVVGFTDGIARVSFLNRDLTEEPLTVTLGPSTFGSSGAPRLQQIDGTLWAFYVSAEGASAVEIAADGTIGRRHLATGFTGIEAERTGGETLVALTTRFPDSTAVSLASFEPEAGFLNVQPLFEAHLFDFYSDAGEFYVVHGDPAGAVMKLSISRVAIDGTTETLSILDEGGPFNGAVIRRTAEGLVLLVSALAGAADPYGLGLYSLPLDSSLRGALAWSDATLLSETATTGYSSPFIVELGDEGLVFWNQITESDSMQAWMRRVDCSGAPVGDPIPLLFGYSDVIGFHNPVTAVSHEDRIVFAWSEASGVFAVSVSVEDASDAVPVRIGSGFAPSLANHNGVIFIVWQSNHGVILGTPLGSDASPLVPGGFPILRSFTEQQSAPVISDANGGFLVLWMQAGIRSVLISAAGTPQSSSSIASASPFAGVHLATSGTRSLAAWEEGGDSILFTFINGEPSGRFPLGAALSSPLTILPRGDGSFALVYSHNSMVFTREITTGAFVPQISAPRLLSRYPLLGRDSAALIGGKPVAVWTDDSAIYAGTSEPSPRRRGISRP